MITSNVETINEYVSTDYSEVSFSYISVASADCSDIEINSDYFFLSNETDSVRTNVYKDRVFFSFGIRFFM